MMRQKSPQRKTRMNRSAGWIVFACALAGFPAQAGAQSAFGGGADLTISIGDVLPAGGIIRLGVYDRARYPDDNSTPVASANVPAVSGQTTVTLHNLPPGTYAIEAYQDVNSNNQMDTSWLGLPQEPFGFSRDAVPFLSKPSFDDVKFTLVAGQNTQVLHLQSLTKASPADRARDAVRARQR
jgi:uncharacterized protein (DUF2141 family)